MPCSPGSCAFDSSQVARLSNSAPNEIQADDATANTPFPDARLRAGSRPHFHDSQIPVSGPPVGSVVGRAVIATIGFRPGLDISPSGVIQPK